MLASSENCHPLRPNWAAQFVFLRHKACAPRRFGENRTKVERQDQVGAARRTRWLVTAPGRAPNLLPSSQPLPGLEKLLHTPYSVMAIRQIWATWWRTAKIRGETWVAGGTHSLEKLDHSPDGVHVCKHRGERGEATEWAGGVVGKTLCWYG